MDNTQVFSDEFGQLLVIDDGDYRTLAFAEDDSQSRMLKSTPHVLQYEYTQAMLLVLLFCQPKRVLLLGLGGGSLMTALHHHIPGIHITAVELRAAVIEIAYRFFRLPRGKRLQVVQQDAALFVQTPMDKKVDVVFVDLYHRDGVDDAQLQAAFIADCAQQLKNNGWLVLNGWIEHQENTVFMDTLQQYFTDIRSVLTGSHNWVIIAGIAGNSLNTQPDSVLKETAAQLSAKLGFSLSRHLARMKQHR
ncbi:MAG: methyltransferase [Thiolinea sp.]